jgi:hypothetical protein
MKKSPLRHRLQPHRLPSHGAGGEQAKNKSLIKVQKSRVLLSNQKFNPSVAIWFPKRLLRCSLKSRSEAVVARPAEMKTVAVRRGAMRRVEGSEPSVGKMLWSPRNYPWGMYRLKKFAWSLRSNRKRKFSLKWCPKRHHRC